MDFSSVKRASLDWCPEMAALSPSADAAGQMPTALSAEQLRNLKATLEELEDMHSKLDRAKVCSESPANSRAGGVVCVCFASCVASAVSEATCGTRRGCGGAPPRAHAQPTLRVGLRPLE